ncbi:MAG: hypothetical protein EOP04_30545 [Proteobacteria bacterium]|nr:MAG: hypothetical protein EOP04_30545 [Pseudomonadota bacterium]
MIRAKKCKVLASLSLTMMLFACGASSDSYPAQAAFDSQNQSASATPVSPKHCTDAVPLDDKPVVYCKNLDNGQSHRVTLKGSTYVQDFETCVVTVVDDGLKTSILEMGFEPCESQVEGEISTNLAVD